MDVHVSIEVENRLSRFAAETGCSPDDLVNEAILAHLDELSRTRQRLNSRYDDLKSGRVQGIDGETARRQSLGRIEARRIAAQGK